MPDISVGAVEREISSRPISPLQYRVGALCALLLVFDGYDIGAISYVIPPIASAWGLQPVDFTLAIVLGGVGMLIGSLVSGPLSDLFGRKPVLMACVAMFGTFSVASAFSETVTFLTVTRFLTGLGLGGGVPAAIALTSDYCPKRHQVILVGLMTGAIPVGLILGGFLSSILIPLYGWPAVFIVGGVIPLLLLPLLAIAMPESVQYLLVRRNNADKAGRILRRMHIVPATVDGPATVASAAGPAKSSNPIGDLFRDGYAMRTVLLWIMFFGNLLAAWLVIFWLPTILSAAGVASGDAAFYSALLPLGGLVGVGLIALLARMTSTETALIVALLTGGAAVFSMWLWDLPIGPTATLIFVSGMGLISAQFGLNGLAASIYPSHIRATGAGWALGIGRVGNIVGPAVGGFIMGLGFSSETMFLVAIIPILFAAAALLLLARERQAGRLEVTPAAVP